VPLPDDLRFVTFDCYGTLIDWETGVYEAFRKEAERDGFTIDREECVNLFLSISREIQGGSYELYAEVLRRTAVRAAREMGWDLEPSRSGFLPGSMPYWPAFDETNPEVGKLRGDFELGVLSNVDDKLLGVTRRHFRFDLDLVVTAQQVRSYKPDPAHFRECARRVGGKKGWVHIASGWNADVEPCLKEKVPVIWVNRRGEEPDPAAKGQPNEVVPDLKSAVALVLAQKK
jgi:2-haloacid dehalogenase/putative hydrolase of the HAD superfamily